MHAQPMCLPQTLVLLKRYTIFTPRTYATKSVSSKPHYCMYPLGKFKLLLMPAARSVGVFGKLMKQLEVCVCVYVCMYVCVCVLIICIKAILYLSPCACLLGHLRIFIFLPLPLDTRVAHVVFFGDAIESASRKNGNIGCQRCRSVWAEIIAYVLVLFWNIVYVDPIMNQS